MAAGIDHFAILIVGIFSHILYFNRGEHHLHVQLYIRGFLSSIFIAITLLYATKQGEQLAQAFSKVGKLSLSYLCGLYSSLLLYRLLFHPLKKFPGPIGAKVSAFWLSLHVRNADAFRKVRALHDKYGPFVRVGPSDLSITHPKAVNLIYDAGSSCTKGAFYDFTRPVVSLQTYRDKSEHDRRRRVWSAAFGYNALGGYEKRIRHYRDSLVAHLAASEGRPVNITKWFSLYNWDIMGDLAFGRSFDMLETSQDHWAVKLLHDGVYPLAFLFPIWFFKFVTSIPGLTKDWWNLIGFCKRRLLERVKSTPDIPDIMSALLAPLKGHEPDQDELNLLTGDSQLIIGAGSDTTATTMTSVFYLLAQHPGEIEKLRQELAPYMIDATGEVLNEKIAHLNHLNGVINEAIRLFPPLPTAVPRKTPPHGISIDGTYIPGGMTVWCPQYALGRSEAIYLEPNNFFPERWYQFPEMVKERSAFVPFNTGPYGCIGKPLAMMNLRTTIARLITTFNVTFAPGENCGRFEEQAVDQTLLVFGELNLIFTPRSS